MPTPTSTRESQLDAYGRTALDAPACNRTTSATGCPYGTGATICGLTPNHPGAHVCACEEH